MSSRSGCRCRTRARTAGPEHRYGSSSLLDVMRHNLEDLFPGIDRAGSDALPRHAQRRSRAGCGRRRIRRKAWRTRWKRKSGSGASSGRCGWNTAPTPAPAQLQMLMRKLDLGEADLYEMPAELDFTDLFPIAGLNRPRAARCCPGSRWCRRHWPTRTTTSSRSSRAGDLLVHHPYESFDATRRPVHPQRGRGPQGAGPQDDRLPHRRRHAVSSTPWSGAAEAGKQVACLVEVTARFDEQARTSHGPRRWTRSASTSSTASSVSRRIARRPWWSGRTTTACAATLTSAPATTTSRRPGCTPTWGCSPATRC